jgi:hypothetical protein
MESITLIKFIDFVDYCINTITLVFIILKCFNLIQWNWLSVLSIFIIFRVISYIYMLSLHVMKKRQTTQDKKIKK